MCIVKNGHLESSGHTQAILAFDRGVQKVVDDAVLATVVGCGAKLDGS